MQPHRPQHPPEILLVEDNPGDIRLITEALNNGGPRERTSIVRDGQDAIEFLHRHGRHAAAPRPDLVLLDLNLPRKNGFEVLREIKTDPRLRPIPVIVLTTSADEGDVRRCYDLSANCYVTKQSGLHEFVSAVRLIRDFWLGVANLPGGE
jgi:CheY-like chemotaxis protein